MNSTYWSQLFREEKAKKRKEKKRKEKKSKEKKENRRGENMKLAAGSHYISGQNERKI